MIHWHWSQRQKPTPSLENLLYNNPKVQGGFVVSYVEYCLLLQHCPIFNNKCKEMFWILSALSNNLLRVEIRSSLQFFYFDRLVTSGRMSQSFDRSSTSVENSVVPNPSSSLPKLLFLVIPVSYVGSVILVGIQHLFYQLVFYMTFWNVLMCIYILQFRHQVDHTSQTDFHLDDCWGYVAGSRWNRWCSSHGSSTSLTQVDSRNL